MYDMGIMCLIINGSKRNQKLIREYSTSFSNLINLICTDIITKKSISLGYNFEGYRLLISYVLEPDKNPCDYPKSRWGKTLSDPYMISLY